MARLCPRRHGLQRGIRVIYMSEKDVDQFDQIINGSWKPPVAPQGVTIEQMFSLLMSAFAWVYKHKSFEEEEEWRLTLSTFPFSPQKPRQQLSTAMRQLLYGEDDPIPGLCFRPGKSMLIPYREIDFSALGTSFIKKVTIGPSPHPDLSAKAVNDLLVTHGIKNCEIKLSEVPYRHW
jgi:hypothetical protein